MRALEFKPLTFRINRQTLFIISGIALLLLSGFLSGKEPPVRVVTEMLPPYQIQNNTQLDGFSVEVVRLLLQEIELDLSIEVMPWPRAFKIASTQPNVIIFSIARSPERESQFHWIGHLHTERYAFFKLDSNTSVATNNLATLNSYSIAIARDTIVEDYAKKLELSNLELTTDIKQMLLMLKSQRVDVVFDAEAAVRYYAQNLAGESDKIVKLYELDNLSSELYVAVNKNSSPALVEGLRMAFQKLAEGEKLKTIRQKWRL